MGRIKIVYFIIKACKFRTAEQASVPNKEKGWLAILINMASI